MEGRKDGECSTMKSAPSIHHSLPPFLTYDGSGR